MHLIWVVGVPELAHRRNLLHEPVMKLLYFREYGSNQYASLLTPFHLRILKTDPELLDARHHILNLLQQHIVISDLYKRTLHGDVGWDGRAW